jgi:hypothetical protein
MPRRHAINGIDCCSSKYMPVITQHLPGFMPPVRLPSHLLSLHLCRMLTRLSLVPCLLPSETNVGRHIVDCCTHRKWCCGFEWCTGKHKRQTDCLVTCRAGVLKVTYTVHSGPAAAAGRYIQFACCQSNTRRSLQHECIIQSELQEPCHHRAGHAKKRVRLT